jgi:16S rRNA processing protein RimM
MRCPAPVHASDLVLIGACMGAIGVRGEIRARSFTQDPASLGAYGALFDARGQKLLTPQNVRPVKNGMALSGPEITSREAAEALRGIGLHVPRAALAPSPDEDEIYVADLIGHVIVHVDGRNLGRVIDVCNFGAGDLIEIETDGVSWLMPFTRENAPRIVAGVIHIDPPFGLVPGDGQ